MLPGIKRVVYVNYTSVKTKTKTRGAWPSLSPEAAPGAEFTGSHRRQRCPVARTTMALEVAASCVGTGMRLSLAHLSWGSRGRMARKGAWTAMSASTLASPCYAASGETSVG